jgi:hypothetical protein
LNPKNSKNHHKPHNLITIITLGLLCKGHTGQRELKIWSESMTGRRVRLEAETAGIRKKAGLILERQGCQRVSGKA